MSALLVYFLTKKRKDFSKVHILNIPLFAAIGAFIGAHMVYGITRLDVAAYIFSHFQDFTSSFGRGLELMGLWIGGMVFYGGLLGAVIAAKMYCKSVKIDFSLYADIFAPAIPLFHAFGRLGCFLGGCCYGIESTWGVVYHSELNPDANGVTRLPIQLIEAGLNLLLMAVLILMSRKKFKKGTLLGVYFFAYAVIRFVDEFYRGDLIRGHLFGLSTSQWISIGVFVLGIVMILRRYVIPSTKNHFQPRVDTGLIPAGYFYNQYSGMINAEQVQNIKYGTVEKSTLTVEED